MKIDDVDEAIIAAFREDGRQSNREVARRLDLSEGTIRQRLKKLQGGGAVRFDVVSDAAHMGMNFVAYVRASVAPAHLEEMLNRMTELPEIWYAAAAVGRFNVIAVIVTESASRAMETINTGLESLAGINDIDVRPIAEQIKHDFYEIVIPKSRDDASAEKLRNMRHTRQIVE